MSARTVPRAMTKAEADEWGQKRYMGEPCRNGHLGWRYVRNDRCCDCELARIRRNRGTEPVNQRRATPATIPKPRMPVPFYLPATSDFIAPVPLSRLMAGR